MMSLARVFQTPASPVVPPLGERVEPEAGIRRHLDGGALRVDPVERPAVADDLLLGPIPRRRVADDERSQAVVIDGDTFDPGSS